MTAKKKQTTIGNWFAINRQLIDSEFWTSEPFTKPQAWIDLIGLARHTDGVAYKRGIEIPLKAGQLCWSDANLAVRWSWSRKKVRRFMGVLERKQQVTQQKTNVTTITTVVNYTIYQPRDTANDTPKGTAKGTTEEQQRVQQAHTKEEGKERKKGEKEKKKENNREVGTGEEPEKFVFSDGSEWEPGTEPF